MQRRGASEGRTTGGPRWRTAGAALAAAVALAGCAGEGATATDGDAPGRGAAVRAATTEASAPEAAPALPVTVTDADARTVTVRSAERIIPLDGDLAEIVFALGLGDKVVATDLSATHPPEADAKPEIGYQRSLAPEPVLSFAPTVLLGTPAAGPPEVIDRLRAAVPFVRIAAPATLDGPAAKIRAVAAALGVPGRGEALARKVQGEIDAAVAAVPRGGAMPRVAALYVRGDRVQQVFGPGSGIHAVLAAAGATDIGELLGVQDNAAITTEAMVRERPEVLVVTTSGLESVGGVEKLLALPAFSRTPVAQTKKVLVFETQLLYGFGPRTGQLVTELVRALHGS
jgi:iron complex transport system substrate-binding protein